MLKRICLLVLLLVVGCQDRATAPRQSLPVEAVARVDCQFQLPDGDSLLNVVPYVVAGQDRFYLKVFGSDESKAVVLPMIVKDSAGIKQFWIDIPQLQDKWSYTECVAEVCASCAGTACNAFINDNQRWLACVASCCAAAGHGGCRLLDGLHSVLSIFM